MGFENFPRPTIQYLDESVTCETVVFLPYYVKLCQEKIY